MYCIAFFGSSQHIPVVLASRNTEHLYMHNMANWKGNTNHSKIYDYIHRVRSDFEVRAHGTWFSGNNVGTSKDCEHIELTKESTKNSLLFFYIPALLKQHIMVSGISRSSTSGYFVCCVKSLQQSYWHIVNWSMFQVERRINTQILLMHSVMVSPAFCCTSWMLHSASTRCESTTASSLWVQRMFLHIKTVANIHYRATPS